MSLFDKTKSARSCLWAVHGVFVDLRRVARSGDEHAVRSGLVSFADALDALAGWGPSVLDEALGKVHSTDPRLARQTRPVPEGPSNLTSGEVESLLVGFSEACRLLANDTSLAISDLEQAMDDLEYIAPEALRRGRRFVISLDEPRARAHTSVVARRFAAAP